MDTKAFQPVDIDVAAYDNAPIGVFDSGYGGLTVARAISEFLPFEQMIFFGDTARCPYGPRDQEEVKEYVLSIGQYLIDQGAKMLVIACNTATAAGLEAAQQTFNVPVLGAIAPGARAAARSTKNKRVGVIGTKGTIASGNYSAAIRSIDAGITVFSTATPRFVEIVENGIRMSKGPIEDLTSEASKAYIRPAFQEIAQDYLEPLRRCDIDTLVLGCTHYPLLKALIGGVIGRDVRLVTSSTELARDVAVTLASRGQLANNGPQSGRHVFFTTSQDIEDFQRFGSRVFNKTIPLPHFVDPQTLLSISSPGDNI
ncbi:MAG: glutamate racemase [Eggerthellaceae bacterium]|nr:glutamate racemase [Eggerthellaceae bacterium]